jgi:hypothetical protein
MPSVSVAAPSAVQITLPASPSYTTTKQPVEELAAGLDAIAKTRSVSVSALLTGLQDGARPLARNTLDSFGAGTIVNTAA